MSRIDGEYFQEGAIAKLEMAKRDSFHGAELAFIHLEKEAERAFSRMEANVDNYLEWYYSLGGEYARIAKLVSGDIEEYISKKLQSHLLLDGDVFSGVQGAIGSVFAEYTKGNQLLQQRTQSILEDNKIVTSDHYSFQIIKEVSIDDILTPSNHQDIINLEKRLLAGGVAGLGAGAISLVVIKDVLGKLKQKNIIKLATEKLLKVALSRTVNRTDFWTHHVEYGVVKSYQLSVVSVQQLKTDN